MSAPALTSSEMDQAQLDAEADEWEFVYEGPPPDPQCICANECTARCPCRKFGSGCSLACLCAASPSCKNQLNDVATLFGVERSLEKPLRATACFTRYLASKKGPDLKAMDMEKLRRKLMGLRRGKSDAIPKSDCFEYEDHDDFLRS
ncbi:hypothetical protein MMC28_007071 [Mycoblastus sanguinarius]|nr:hypothetical protein [Mycoblastus sanguinarius]